VDVDLSPPHWRQPRQLRVEGIYILRGATTGDQPGGLEAGASRRQPSLALKLWTHTLQLQACCRLRELGIDLWLMESSPREEVPNGGTDIAGAGGVATGLLEGWGILLEVLAPSGVSPCWLVPLGKTDMEHQLLLSTCCRHLRFYRLPAKRSGTRTCNQRCGGRVGHLLCSFFFRCGNRVSHLF
jgi:hypothetical protein